VTSSALYLKQILINKLSMCYELSIVLWTLDLQLVQKFEHMYCGALPNYTGICRP